MNRCPCMQPPFSFGDFESASLGIDETNGRYGEVSVERCRECGAKWLKYFVEYESFTASGRWYRGLVTDAMIDGLTP